MSDNLNDRLRIVVQDAYELFDFVSCGGRELIGHRFGGVQRPDPAEAGVIILTCERPVSDVTLRGFVLLVVAFLGFKSLVIAHLGVETYAGAIQKLQHGAMLEQAAAFIMRPDVMSQFLAGQIGPILR